MARTKQTARKSFSSATAPLPPISRREDKQLEAKADRVAAKLKAAQDRAQGIRKHNDIVHKVKNPYYPYYYVRENLRDRYPTSSNTCTAGASQTCLSVASSCRGVCAWTITFHHRATCHFHAQQSPSIPTKVSSPTTSLAKR